MIDEDYQSPIFLPWPNAYRALPAIDMEEVPAGKLINVIQDKDDYWINLVRPVPATLFQPLPYLFGREYSENYEHAIYSRYFTNFVEINVNTFLTR